MRLKDCLAKVDAPSQWDVRFHILAEGANGRLWPVTFSACGQDLLDAWKMPEWHISVPENGDLVHGLMFVSLLDSTVLLANEADLDGYDFEALMQDLNKD